MERSAWSTHKINLWPIHQTYLASTGAAVTIQKVAARTKYKSNIHFDLQADDLNASQSYAVALGGKLIEVKRKGQWEWRIMADPEGNLFCLVMQ